MTLVPEALAHGTVEREGERGSVWLAELPGLVAELLGRWDCTRDGAVTHGGVGLVVPVRWRDGVPAVVKVSFPHPGNVHEPDAFEAWGGAGAVRLYARDDARFAMLLERARPETLAEVADGDRVVTVAARLGRRLAVPAPPGVPLLRDRADAWEAELLRDAREVPHTLGSRAVDAAVATVRELGGDQPDLMVHGDLHPRNVLRAEREPWLAIDPKGCAGDPAYDGGTLLKSRVPALLGADDPAGAVRRVLDVFAEAAELDRERVYRWAQFHAVSAVFWGRRHGFRVARGGPGLDRLLDAAERLVESLTGPGRRPGVTG
ncbi:aminoglycoside phosphotransferase family protein [Streptomyces sp. NPDC015131]|uniref:aminoglycoside phosphotransferase family protein n=1 Tax=Streptomyces sp. NPDC015131 TaxID=3364941 RepID=UPI0036F6AF41